MTKDKENDGKVKYSKEEIEDPVGGLAKQLKKLKKKFKRLRRSVRGAK